MFQMKFDDKFKTCIKDIPRWTSDDDIPEPIKNYMSDKMPYATFYDDREGVLKCPKCLEPLVDFSCPKCNISYPMYDLDELQEQAYIYRDDIELVYYSDLDSYNQTKKCEFFYAFDVLDKAVYLYLIRLIATYYYNPFDKCLKRTTKGEIHASFLVEKDGLTDLENYRFYSFEDIENHVVKNNDDGTFNELIQINNIFAEGVYVENLNDLEDTVYHYTNFWKAKRYLDRLNSVHLEYLTIIPLYYEAFEYLVKLRLFNLAFFSSQRFKKGKTFKSILGVPKSFLPYMVEHDISYPELEFLRNNSEYDYSIVRYFSSLIYYREDAVKLLKDIKIDYVKLKKYLQNVAEEDETDRLGEYLDYIMLAKRLGFDLKDKKVLYPKDLMAEHDKLYLQSEMIKDPKIEEKIGRISKKLKVNRYEDDNYIIYPAASISDILKEGEMQRNCVRTYCEKYANEQCELYFMRKKTDLATSFVTIEVVDRHIVQAKMKFNEPVPKNLEKLLDRWEKALISQTDEQHSSTIAT